MSVFTTSFSAFSAFLTREILGLFTLSMSLLFDFISFLLLSLFLDIISFFSDEVRCSFSIEYFLGIFDSRLICESLEAGISSGEESERSIIVLVLKEVSIEISNIF